MHLAGEEGSTPEPAGRGQLFQKLQQQMALGHQPNTHSVAEANLAACKPWPGSPWCVLKLYLDFLVPQRTHFVPALQSAWIGSGAVISCLITLSAWHCNSTLCLGNAGLGMVSMSLSLELDPLWNECWGQGELMGEGGLESNEPNHSLDHEPVALELSQEGQKKGSKSRVHHSGNFHHH